MINSTKWYRKTPLVPVMTCFVLPALNKSVGRSIIVDKKEENVNSIRLTSRAFIEKKKIERMSQAGRVLHASRPSPPLGGFLSGFLLRIPEAGSSPRSSGFEPGFLAAAMNL